MIVVVVAVLAILCSAVIFGSKDRKKDKNTYDQKKKKVSAYDESKTERKTIPCPDAGKKRKSYLNNGFSEDGTDRAGKARIDYKKEVTCFEKSLRAIKKKMDEKELRYALLDIRIELEKVIEIYLVHWNGCCATDKLIEKIDECRMLGLNDDQIDKLHSARMHCNASAHGQEREYNQVYFCYKVLEEMLQEVKSFTV